MWGLSFIKLSIGERMYRERIKTELLIHDLKGPLAIIEAGIVSLIEHCDRYGPINEKQLKVLERALRNAKVAKGLVNDIMEVGKSTEGIINKNTFLVSDFVKYPLVEILDLTDCNTAECIRESVDLSVLKEILEKKDILLDIDDTLWSLEVCLDKSKMRQILRNLVNNALKYRKKRVEIGLMKEGGSLLLSVSDDGEGIGKDYHDKIFECYFQLDEGKNHCIRGHGLGLAGTMILIEDMGGKMSLESDVGKGTKFSVKMPLKS